jgi:hypothetical protein
MTQERAQPGSFPAPIVRSAPFIAPGCAHGSPVLLLGSYEIPLGTFAQDGEFQDRLRRSLDLSAFGPQLSANEFIVLLEEQYSAAEEYVYGHPIWGEIRTGSERALHAYILETRHYLAAAASRMSPSIGAGIGLSPMALLLSRHLLEEWDHAKFFEKALDHIGCAPDWTRLSRPLPATLEWIHFSRHIASTGEIASAVCSGFMEHSSVESEAVCSWHQLIARKELVCAEAVDAIFGHFSTDLDFGHSANWKKAVSLNGSVTPSFAAGQLNSVAALSEMIFRWLTALQKGAASDIVLGMQLLREDAGSAFTADASMPDAKIFDGLPVWSCAVLDAVSARAATATPASDVAVGMAYGFAHCVDRLHAIASPMARMLCTSIEQLGAVRPRAAATAQDANTEIVGWLRAIDGHRLWTRMVDAPSYSLVSGYLLENYHYLASAARHIAPAIAACTDAGIRVRLIRHLEDELTHCDILCAKLRTLKGVGDPDRCRPLPTTIAFVGFLQSLARQDWKAYVIASVFLQRSLSETRADDRGRGFYAAIRGSDAALGEILASMSSHDDTDADLDHDRRPLLLLDALHADGGLTRQGLGLAAMAPTLAWGFLDGIASHYADGEGTLCQRMAWTG